MVTHWYRRLRGLWRGHSVDVGRSRSSSQRLSVAVDPLSDGACHFDDDGFVNRGPTDDVLRLLHRDERPTPHRPRPFNGPLAGLGSYSRPLPRDRDTSYIWGNYAVTYDGTARYSDGDTEDFVPSWIPVKAQWSDCE